MVFKLVSISTVYRFQNTHRRRLIAWSFATVQMVSHKPQSKQFS